MSLSCALFGKPPSWSTLLDTNRGNRGAFDCIAELWPHIAMILYRLFPLPDEFSARAHHYHVLMSRIFLSVAIMEVVGTTLETIVVFWLWGSLWHKWTLPFKVVTPILHILFSCAQAWGAWVFWQLSKKEARKAAGVLSSGVLTEETESTKSTLQKITDTSQVKLDTA